MGYFFLWSRRIHISKATLDFLEGTYKTEDGHGRERNEFLRRHNIDTYLICPPDDMSRINHAEPAKVQKMTTELPFGNAIDMNSVGSELQNIRKT